MPSTKGTSNVRDEEVREFIENACASAVMQGELKLRPSRGEVWIQHSFVLTASELLVLESTRSGHSEGLNEVLGMYDICPSCSVFETNLGQFTFELVTPRKILHVKSESREVTAAWIDNIRKVIAESEPNMADPVVQLAIAKIDEDVFYDVSFHDDRVPLGVVLERSGEWAIVKRATKPELGVRVGSALTSVNGESCVFKSHEYTIGKLKNWKPPLRLGFRVPVTKYGYLLKRPQHYQSGSTASWQSYFFFLGDGRLIYKDDGEANTKVKGGVPLKGSAVSLVSSSETGKFFCFRVVSGVTSLVMQGETQDEMMDWAATLYHAIAIANGGGHIISLERMKLSGEGGGGPESEEREVASKSEEVEEVSVPVKSTEEAGRIRQEQDEARAVDEEVVRKKAEEEAALREEARLREQQAARVKAEEEAAAHEAARIRAEEEAALVKAEEEAALREEARLREEEEARLREEEEARIREEEENSRVRAEEEAAKAKAERDAQLEKELETGVRLAIDAMERARLQKLESGNYTAKSSFMSSDRALVNVRDLVEEDKRRQRLAETRTLTTDEQFAAFFKKYARVIDGFENMGPVLTPVQFSAMLRLVTGEKGNLFSEMKTFNKFDDDGNGFLNIEEFILGFKEIAKTNASMVDRISELVGEGDVIGDV